MAIKGEVHVKSMVWLPKISTLDGRYVIRPFECKIIGKVEGFARIRASIHTLFTTFDDEEWRIITLFVNHLDSKFKYTDLFADQIDSWNGIFAPWTLTFCATEPISRCLFPEHCKMSLWRAGLGCPCFLFSESTGLVFYTCILVVDVLI